nr:heavy-metal-associated domain-containing protein [uncultured Arsenicibacter sp.]
MNVLRKTATIAGWTVVACLTGLLTWANWEAPPLHAQAKPVGVALLKVDGLTDEAKAAGIRREIDELPGVTACSANPASRLVGVTYDTDIITEKELTAFVKKQFNEVSLPSVEEPAVKGPQCPVPMEYILKMERLKYALCFR